jgi:hypothetical protein
MALKDKNYSGIATLAEKGNVVVSEEVGNYEKHPFFVKKAKNAKNLLEKVGLPKMVKRKEPAQ